VPVWADRAVGTTIGVRRPRPHHTGAVTGVTINIDGLLKGLSKKEILVATDEGHTTSLRRTSKTKFFHGNKDVKADEAALEGNVSVEAAENKDSKLTAVVVPMYLKSSVNLCGASTKSQAARIISTRLREELGGTGAAEWKAARQIGFKTTALALNTEPGMVCSMTHEDMPGGSGEFRVVSWKLNKDFSIDVQGRTTTDSMYDLVAGPKPADVELTPVPEEILYDTGVPGIILGTPKLSDYGTFVLDEMEVQPDAAGNMNIVSAHEITMMLFYVDELATDLWDSLDAAIDRDTDPATVACTMNPGTSKVFRVGDYIVFNDEAKSPDVGHRRCYKCAQIIGPGAEGDVVPSGNFQFQRKVAGDTRVDWPWASFETLRTSHSAGIRFFKLDSKTFTYSVKKGFFRTPGLPARIEAKLPTACVVAAVVGVANNFGYGTFVTFPLSHHSEPYMPGDRTCNGGAYTFQIPGALAVADTVVIPMRVQDSASIRCIYAYV